MHTLLSFGICQMIPASRIRTGRRPGFSWTTPCMRAGGFIVAIRAKASVYRSIRVRPPGRGGRRSAGAASAAVARESSLAHQQQQHCSDRFIGLRIRLVAHRAMLVGVGTGAAQAAGRCAEDFLVDERWTSVRWPCAYSGVSEWACHGNSWRGRETIGPWEVWIYPEMPCTPWIHAYCAPHGSMHTMRPMDPCILCAPWIHAYYAPHGSMHTMHSIDPCCVLK
jgi:hypothetical protein